MSRTNANGKSLKAALSYRLEKTVSVAELSNALGINRSTYYTRADKEDFPNGEECIRVARHFHLNPVELQLAFGLFSADEVKKVADDIPLLAWSATRTASPAPRFADAVRNKIVGAL